MSAARVLVVHCHPSPESLAAAVRDAVCDALRDRGDRVDLLDLYAEGFDPAMSRAEWEGYHEEGPNLAPIRPHAERLAEAEALIFTYPTWWFGQPAMLKGWLERVMVPGFAFVMPDASRGPRPGLTHIRRIGVFTTCGASRLTSHLVGLPGKRILLRGLRGNCHPGARTCYHALYEIDSAPREKCAAFLARIPQRIDRLLGARTLPLPTAGSLARRNLDGA